MLYSIENSSQILVFEILWYFVCGIMERKVWKYQRGNQKS